MLHEQDYLVIPGFGGFVLKHRSAHFDSSGRTLLPPAKSVSFNVQLRQNDGLLCNWLQQQLSCGQAEAMQHIQDFSAFCLSLLNSKRRLSMEGLGFFYLDFENNICFEPQPENNFATESFGLDNLRPVPLEQKPVREEPRREVYEDRLIAAETPAKSENRKLRRYSRTLYGVAGLAIIFLLFFALLSNRTIYGPLNAALAGSSGQGSYRQMDYEVVKGLNYDNSLPTYVSDANGIAALHLGNTEVAVRIRENVEVSGTEGEFEIVLGCFSQLGNAKRLVSKLNRNSIRSEVSGKNNKGLFVVSAGRFSNHRQAEDKLEEIRLRQPNAWIRHR